MASQSQGIHQLLQAEKRAKDKLEEAKKSKFPFHPHLWGFCPTVEEVETVMSMDFGSGQSQFKPVVYHTLYVSKVRALISIVAAGKVLPDLGAMKRLKCWLSRKMTDLEIKENRTSALSLRLPSSHDLSFSVLCNG